MVMMQVCKDNYDTDTRRTGGEWIYDDMRKHQEAMIDLLLRQPSR